MIFQPVNCRIRTWKKFAAAIQRQRFRFAAAIVLAGMLLAAGCAKVPQTHFYTLEPPSMTASGKTLPYDVEVARFRAAFRLSQDRLVFMPSPYHVDYYNYHRWAGYPADMVTAALISSLKHAGVFRSVSDVHSGGKPDFILRGEIENLEELDSGASATARVALTLDAYDVQNRAVVWSGAADYQKQVTAGTVDDVARELNEGVRQSLEKLTHELAAGFPEKKAAP
jgi:ABC-type uncharacterized transport system auxiliary subunit